MKNKKKLLALAMEYADRQPICARLTMSVARLVMEEWKYEYDRILRSSGIEEFLR